MKRNAILIIAAVFCCAASALEPAAQYDFDGNTGKAEVKGKIRYVEGIRGQAAALANAKITFPCPAGVTPAEGTVTLWVKPLNWDSSAKEFVFFLQNVNREKNGRIILYKYKNPGLGLTFWFGNPGGKHGRDCCYTNAPKQKLEKGQWTHLAVTWSRKSNLIAIFVNGQMAVSSRCKDGMFFDKFGDFMLNAPSFRPENRQYETAYDLVKIYSSALTEKEIGENYRKELSEPETIPLSAVKKTVFSLPKMKKAPRIDGNFIEEEWSDAARLGGFVELGAPRLQCDLPGEVYAGCDDENLYFCLAGKLIGNTQLVNKVNERDGRVFADDSFEIHLRPPELERGNYQAIINYSGAVYDAFCGQKNWNGRWKTKSGIYEGTWFCEVSVPLADLKSRFRENSQWAFNLCRDLQKDPNIIFSSVSPSGMPFAAHYGQFRLTGQDCFGRLEVDYSRLFEHQLDLKMTIRNLSDNPKKATVKTELIASSGKVVSCAEQTAEIPAGGEHVFPVRDPLTGFRSGIIRISATDEAGTLIHRQDLPLVFRDEASILTETDLTAGKLFFEVDLKSHYALAKTAELEAVLHHETGRKVTCKAKGDPIAKGEFDLKPLPPGDCELEFIARDGEGRELMRLRENYKHVGIPRWLTEKQGLNAGVVYPYTPIRRNGNRLEVIGREHEFGKTLLPEQIVSQKVRLFAAKPVLRGKINGKAVVFDNFRFTETEDTPSKCAMDFTASAGGLNLFGTVTLEFDGLLWYRLDLEKSDVTVEELILEMTLPASVAEFYNGHFFSRENYVGKFAGDLELKRMPSLWTGNLDVGLTFVTESFQYWRNNDEKTAYRFRSEGKNRVWQIRFIDRPTKLKDKSFHYAFGLEANPVKPTPPQFRSWRVWFFKPFTISHPWQIDMKIKKYPGSGGFFTPEHTSMEAFRDEVKKFRDNGAELSLYLNPFLLSTETTEYKIFRKQWRNPYNTYPLCPASNFTDYIAWQIDDHIKRGGLQCVYVDSLGAYNCANPLHGCGYIDENGVQKLTWPIRAMRRYMQRIYSLLHADGRDQSKNWLWAHMSARTSAPINAFVDFQCSGEELETQLVANSNYLEHYGLDAYQIYYLPSSGVVPMLLPNLGRIGPKEHRLEKRYNDQFLLLVLLHDSLLWNLWCDIDYVNRLYRKLDDFGWQDPKLQFHSYRTQKLVTSPDADIRISVYTLGNRAAAVIGNMRKNDRKIRVVIDRHALGLPESAKLTDLRTGRELSRQALEALPVAGYNFALIKIGE